MYNWKITQTLIEPEAPEWEELALNALGEGVHPDRKMGFFLSRMALKRALKDQGLDLTIPQLTLVNYDKVVNFPQLTISLSHTKDCGAALIAERKIFRAVGIDIEHENRVVKEMIVKRISHPHDINLRNIELWCIKEAVFKALMNTRLFENPLEFGSIQLQNQKWFHKTSGLEGSWETKLASPYLVALAFLKN